MLSDVKIEDAKERLTMLRGVVLTLNSLDSNYPIKNIGGLLANIEEDMTELIRYVEFDLNDNGEC